MSKKVNPIMVKHVGQKELVAYAHELNDHREDAQTRIAKWLKRNRKEEFQVPEYQEMLDFTRSLVEVYDEVQDEAYAAHERMTDLLDKLEEINSKRKWGLNLQEMEDLRELNGNLDDALSDYQSIVSILKPRSRSPFMRRLNRVARKIGSTWFSKWLQGSAS